MEPASEIPPVTASWSGKGLEVHCSHCKTVSRMGGGAIHRTVDLLNGFLAQHAACTN